MQERKKKSIVVSFLSLPLLMGRLLKHLPPVTWFLVFCFLLFGLGFVSFSEKTDKFRVPSLLQAADGIIVLTGGRARLETGLQLLEAGRGKRLLISGVNPMAGRRILMQAMHADPDLFECCVDLGREAMNTAGNAEESAQWVKKNSYHKVFIVTNNYHMPRSLAELKRKMPDTELFPYPVGQDNISTDRGFYSFEQLRILMLEYIKFLGVCARDLVMPLCLF